MQVIQHPFSQEHSTVHSCPLMSTDVHWIHDTSSIGAHLSDLQHAGGGNLRQGGKSQRIASAALLSF